MSKISRSKLAKAYVGLLDRHDHRELSVALANMVVAHKLTKEVDLLIRDIRKELLEQHGHLEAEIVSARPLGEGLVSDIRKRLKEITGAGSVSAVQAIDESLLGGVLIKTPEAEIDLSIISSLRALEA